MSFGLGVAAALGGPFVMTIGFIIWEDHWKGSAFSLNLFKCCTASIGFLILSLTVRGQGQDDNEQAFPSDIFTRQAVGFLFLSSTIGIVIGDLMWLEGLRLLGARRVIMMDSLKPFLAALFGWLILDEELRPAAIGGIGLTVAGVLLVALETSSTTTEEDKEKEKPAENENISDENMTTTPDATGTADNSRGEAPSDIELLDDIDDPIEMDVLPLEAPPVEPSAAPPPSEPLKKHRTIRQMRLGYALSILNVALDTYGAVLIKQYGEGMTVWEINLLRFGFAGLIMLVLSIVVHVRARIIILRQQPGIIEPADQAMVGSRDNDDDDDDVTEKEGKKDQQRTAWYALPMKEMTRSSWAHVSGGVLLVTFLTPTLSNYALFEIAIALALTLGSVGPLYALPLAYFLQKQVPTVRAYAGAVLAVAGIVVLAFRGTLPEEEANI
jgi:drug/metabolite transporter (DMT)-like permease